MYCSLLFYNNKMLIINVHQSHLKIIKYYKIQVMSVEDFKTI